MKNGPYILIIAPSDYPGKKYRNRYAYEHHVVYWKTYGRVPKNGEMIHHKNHNRHDNKISNLVLMTPSEHRLTHSDGRVMLDLICGFCKKLFIREKRTVQFKRSYCSKKCQHNSLVGRTRRLAKRPSC